MRCLIFGGDGMLGHQLLASLSVRHEVRVTLRRSPADYASYGLFHSGNSFYGIDVERPETVERAFSEFHPEAVVNAVGVVKQRREIDPRQMLEVNAVFPRRLLALCRAHGSRLVQLSTDCVFNGRRGGYRTDDAIDAEDLYGLSKYLGELNEAPAITLRSSIIGLELARKTSLVEWFLAQRGTIRGFTRAIYSGLTTLEMARVVERCLTDHRDLCGLWQVASQPIDKFDLLSRLSQKLSRKDLTIKPDDSFVCDRRLSGREFTARTGYSAPNWNVMLDELVAQVRERGNLSYAA